MGARNPVMESAGHRKMVMSLVLVREGSKVIDCRVHSAHFDFLEVWRRHHLYTLTFIHLKHLMILLVKK